MLVPIKMSRFDDFFRISLYQKTKMLAITREKKSSQTEQSATLGQDDIVIDQWRS